MDNKTFAIIGIIIVGILQVAAYINGFDGQLTVLLTGVITYLFGIITGQQATKAQLNAIKEVADKALIMLKKAKPPEE